MIFSKPAFLPISASWMRPSCDECCLSLRSWNAERASSRTSRSFVVVKDLDRLRNGNRLLRTVRHALLVLLARVSAALLQLGHELLVLAKGILSIGQVVLQVHDLDSDLAVLLRLRLDRLRRSLDLLLLRAHERLELRLSSVLLLGRVSQLLLHVLQELLQDPNDLARRRRVLRGRRQELRQRVAGVTVHGLASKDELAESTGRVALQEAAGHALHDRIDRLLARGDVRLRLRRLLRERTVLLLALRRRRVDRRLRILAVLLVLREISLELRLRAKSLLDRRLNLRDLRLQLSDTVSKLLAVRLAVAHVLLVHLLVLLTILLDLLRHHLQEVHDPADRVLRHLLLALDGSCLYSYQRKQEGQDTHVDSLRLNGTSV